MAENQDLKGYTITSSTPEADALIKETEDKYTVTSTTPEAQKLIDEEAAAAPQEAPEVIIPKDQQRTEQQKYNPAVASNIKPPEKKTPEQEFLGADHKTRASRIVFTQADVDAAMAQMKYQENLVKQGWIYQARRLIDKTDDDTLEHVSSHTGMSYLDKPMALISKEPLTQLKKLIMDESPVHAIPASRAFYRKVFEPIPGRVGMYTVNVDELPKTYLPRDEVAKLQLIAANRAVGKPITPEELDKVVKLSKVGGTLANKDRGIINELGAALDQAGLALYSGRQYASARDAMGFTTKPADVTVLGQDSDLYWKVHNAINNAPADGTPVPLQTEYGKIQVSKYTKLDDVDDFLYREYMKEQLERVYDSSQSGISKSLGLAMSLGLESLGVKALMIGGKTVLKASPKLAKAAALIRQGTRVMPDVVNKVGGKVLQHTIMGGVPAVGSTYYGRPTSDVQKEEQAKMAGAFGVGLPLAMEGLMTGSARLYRRVVPQALEHIPAGEFENTIRNAKSYDELPKNYRNGIPKEKFEQTQKFYSQTEALHNDAIAQNMDLRTPEHFKQTLQADTPLGQKLRDTLEMHEFLSNDMTLEGSRHYQALKSTLGDVDLASGEIKLGESQSRLLNKYRSMVETPNEMVQDMRLNHPEIAAKFENALGGTYKPDQFYWSRAKEMFNAPLSINSSQLGPMINLFGEKLPSGKKNQEFMSGLRERAKTQTDLDMQRVMGKLRNEIDEATQGSGIIADNLRENIHILGQAEGVDQAKLGKLLNFVDDLQANARINKGYAETAAGWYQDIGGDAGAMKTQLADYSDFQRTLGDKLQEFANEKSASMNFTKGERTNQKVRTLHTDAGREAFYLTENGPQANLDYIRNSYFNGGEFPVEAKKAIYDLITAKLPGLQSVDAERAIIADLANDRSGRFSKAEKEGLRRFRNALTEYNVDAKRFVVAQRIMNDPKLSIVSKLAQVKNLTGVIRNPTMAIDLQDALHMRRGEFLDIFENAGVNMNAIEKNALWDSLTGNSYAQLKAGVINGPLFNINTVDSMLKAHEVLGTKAIDTYGQIYRTVFGDDLNRASFHAFFCTPLTRFDENSGFFSGLMREAVNRKVDLMKMLGGQNPVIQMLINIRGYDAMEQFINHKMGISSGISFSSLANETRTAHRLAQGIILGQITDPEFGHMNLLKELEGQSFYPYMDNETFDLMTKKANILSGFNGEWIDKFGEDGSWKLTKFGEFLDDMFNDEVFLAELSEMSRAGRHGAIEDAIYNRAMYEGWTDKNQIRPGGNTEAGVWMESVRDYWNMYTAPDAKEMWNHMKTARKFDASWDARKLKIQNIIIARNNVKYAKIGGAQLQPIKFRSQRLRNSHIHKGGLAMSNPFMASFEDMRNFHLLGDSTDGIIERSVDFNQDTSKGYIKNLLDDTWTGITSAQTAHARSAFEADALGARDLGFDAIANWEFDRAGLLSNTSLQMADQRLDSLITNLLANRNIPKLISIPVTIGSHLVNMLANPLGGLVQISSLMKNSAQAAEFSLLNSEKNLKKWLHVPVSPLRFFVMPVLYNKEGVARGWYGKMLAKSSAAYAVGERIIRESYRDPVQSSKMRAYMTQAQGGLIPGGGVKTVKAHLADGDFMKAFTSSVMAIDDKILLFNDKMNDIKFSNLKERSEIQQSRIAMNQGVVTGESVLRALGKGDDNAAYELIRKSFPDQAPGMHEWHLQNFKRHLAAGTAIDAFEGWLPAYHDQNIGRFGRLCQPSFVNRLTQLTPWAGLFNVATNMARWKLINHASQIIESKGDARINGVKAMLAFAVPAMVTSLYWDYVSGGALQGMNTVADLLPDDVKNSYEDWKLSAGADPDPAQQSPIFKLLAYGQQQMLDTTGYSNFDLSYFGDKGIIKGSLEVLAEIFGMSGMTRGGNVPILGLAANQGFSMYGRFAQKRAVDGVLNAPYTEGPHGILTFNRAMLQELMETFQPDSPERRDLQTYMTQPSAGTHQKVLEYLQRYEQSTGPRMFDMMYKYGPFNAFADMFSDPVTAFYIWYSNMQARGGNLPDIGRETAYRNKKVEGYSRPFTTMADMTPGFRPVLDFTAQGLGLDHLFQDSFEDTINGWIEFFDQNKIMGVKATKRMQKKLYERFKDTYGLEPSVRFSELQVPEAETEEDVQEQTERDIEGKGFLP